MEVLPFEGEKLNKIEEPKGKRDVTEEDRVDLKNAVVEVLHDLGGRNNGIETKSSKWFSMTLIDDVVKHFDHIFSIGDLTSKFPVFFFYQCTTCT